MLGHSPSKALPTSHVVPFTNDTLTFYPLHPDGTSPNSNCVYLMIRSAQYRTQRNHCSGPLYKGSCLVSPSPELRTFQSFLQDAADPALSDLAGPELSSKPV